MKNLTDVLEGILSSIDKDVDDGVAVEQIYTYLKRPHDFEWSDFLYTVEKWATAFGPADDSYRDKKLCENQLVVFIGKIDSVPDDHFRLKVTRGDYVVAIFCGESIGALIYAEAPNGMTQVKKIPAWSSLAIADEMNGSRKWLLLADLPYYDAYYKFLADDCDALKLPKTSAKKIARIAI